MRSNVQSLLLMHSGSWAQATAEQTDEPTNRGQQIPLRQSCPVLQLSSGTAAQLLVQTAPLGLAQHVPELHSAGLLQPWPLLKGAPARHLLASQWKFLPQSPEYPQESRQTPLAHAKPLQSLASVVKLHSSATQRSPSQCRPCSQLRPASQKSFPTQRAPGYGQRS